MKQQAGFSLIQVMIAGALMAGLMVAYMNFHDQQLKSTNYIEFLGKKEQLRLTLMGQFLNDPTNCKCLIGPVTFPTAGTASLTLAPAPTKLGHYKFTTPGDCSTAVMNIPYVSTAGVDGLLLSQLAINDVQPSGTGHTGTMVIDLTTSPTKPITGPKITRLSFPLNIFSVPSGGAQQFDGCSISAGLPMTKLCIKARFQDKTSGTKTWGADTCSTPNNVHQTIRSVGTDGDGKDSYIDTIEVWAQ